MASSRLRVGLAYHASSGSPDISDESVFSDLEAALVRRFDVVRMSSWASSFDVTGYNEAAAHLIENSDMIVVTFGCVGVLETRKKLQSTVPVLYLAMGELPRGAESLRRAAPYLNELDYVLVSCKADLAIWRRLFEESGPRVALVPFAIDQQIFVPLSSEHRQTFRRRMGWADEDIVIFYAGRIIPEKNVQTMLKVCDDIMEAYPNTRLVITGKVTPIPMKGFGPPIRGFEWKYLHEVTRGPKGHPERFQLLPPKRRSALPEIYGSVDIFVNMTVHHDENFGLSQIEAMACGLPVVGADWGGLKDTIRNGITGFRVPTIVTKGGVHVDRYCAAEQIKALIRTADIRVEMGKKGRQEVAKLYHTSVFQDRVESIVDSALQCRGSGREISDMERLTLTHFGEQLDNVIPKNRIHHSSTPDIVEQLRGTTDSAYFYKNIDIYMGLIAPYGSRVENGYFEIDDILDICPLMWSIEREHLSITDFLWTRIYELSRMEFEIFKHVHSNTGVSVFELKQVMLQKYDEEGIDKSLKEMLVEGVLYRSDCMKASLPLEGDGSISRIRPTQDTGHG